MMFHHTKILTSFYDSIILDMAKFSRFTCVTERKDNMKKNFAKRIAAASLSLAMLAAPVLSVGVGAEEEAPLYTVSFYRDAEKTQAVELSEVAEGETVYYTVDMRDGCFYTFLSTNGSYTDNEKMIFNTADREVEVDAYLAGDITCDGELDTHDIVRGMKYISGTFEVGELSNDALIAFDSNFDGMINVKDLVRAMKLIAGVDVDLGIYAYCGAKRAFTDTVRYSAINADASTDAFYVDIITSLDEFNAYIKNAAVIYDYDGELIFANESDAERYKDRMVDVDALKARYNADYFNTNMLIVATLLSIDEATDPVINSVTKLGLGTPCINAEYRWENAGSDPVGAIGCYAHHFIETEKMTMNPSYNGDDMFYAAGLNIKGIQELLTAVGG